MKEKMWGILLFIGGNTGARVFNELPFDPEVWEFKASATIHFKEKKGTSIPVNAQREIKGRAIVKEIKNAINQILPHVEQILITNY